MNLSLAAGDLVLVNHLIQFVEPTVKPTKQITSKQGKYSLSEKQDAELPSKITVSTTQFTSNTSYAFVAVHGVSHVHVKYIVTGRVTIRDGQDNEIQSMCPDLSLPQPSNWQGPKQRSLEISACVAFAPFHSMSSGLAYCWVHSHTGFESVTSTNSAKAALKAITEMQVSADRTKTNDIFSFDDFIDQSSSSSKLIVAVGHHKLIELINGFGCHIKFFKLSELIVNLFLNPNYT